MNLKKTWRFIWYEDSLLSWIVNIIIAIILVKFVIYPGLGLILGTEYPVVAVISSSMEHNNLDFEKWWESNKELYEENKIEKEEFEEFDFKNGFNKGDIFVVKDGTKKIKTGDVIVYNNLIQNTPIIHRVVKVENETLTTKGDNVGKIQNFEKNIKEEQIFGRAILKIPYLGWLKVWFNDYIVKPLLE